MHAVTTEQVRTGYDLYLELLAHKNVEFTLRDDLLFLKHAYRSRTMNEKRQKEIWEGRGVQWSELDRLPSWLPAPNGVPDLLHGGFLGMACIHRTIVPDGPPPVAEDDDDILLPEGPPLGKAHEYIHSHCMQYSDIP